MTANTTHTEPRLAAGRTRLSRWAAAVLSCVALVGGLEGFGTYTTSFSLTENPISEGGNWLNGGTDGLDWANVKTAGGNAVGTQIKNAHYNDSTAILTGAWGANQRVRCTVFKNGPSDAGQPEVEIRLRSVVGAHVNRGYEILFSTNGLYEVQIVRWDGLDDFHYINGASSQHVLADGDVVEAEIVGGHLRAWINGTLITQADDSTWTDGNPGIGFWNIARSQAENDRFGFKDFVASDGSPPGVPTAPSPAMGATSVSLTPTLTWGAMGATSYDVRLGTTNPPPVVSTGQPAASYTPAPLSAGTPYYWQVVAHNSSGTTPGPLWSFDTVPKGTPTLTWPSPAAIVYGTPLSATQLNASADVPGTFVYSPPPGTVLPVGAGQTLSVTFTPTDTANYLAVTASVTLDVTPASPPTIVTTSPLTAGAVARSYHVAFEASGGAPGYSWLVVSGQLPPGLTLTPSGAVDGKPEVAGSYSFRVRVTDAAAGVSERDFSLTVDVLRRHFAEGASSGLFDCYFALVNPNTATTATVVLTFLRSDSVTHTHTEVVPPRSRRTVNVKDVPGMWFAPAFSTVVESNVEVVADRTMSWDGAGYGTHAETAIKEPAPTWYLAEGATQNGFQLYYCIENPNADPVDVQVTYLRRSPNPPFTITYPDIPGHTRKTIYVNGEDPRLAWGDVSGVISSLTPDRPIIVERAMYQDSGGVMFNAGHASAGVTAPATEWFLAEGATVSTFDMYITLANPDDTSGTATITYMLTDGRNLVKTYPVAAGSRQTIWVNGESDDADPTFTLSWVSLSAKIQSTVPIIVERVMWWGAARGGPWHESHNAAGTTETGTLWAVADGEQGGSRSAETYVVAANTSPFPASVQLTVLAEDGEAGSVISTLPANSRKTFWLGETGWNLTGRKFGATVESLLTAEGTAQIVVERAMYSNANGVVWAAGTAVVATKLR